MEKLLLIDGHSILNRAFYGVPMLTNAEGIPTNAIYGFLNIMLKILEEEKPQYLTVAFDVHAPTFRHKKYDAYKGTRSKMPEELRVQVPLMKDVLRAMRIPVVEKEGYEADDVLGTLSRQSEREGIQAVILSGDRDLLQLATDTIQIRIPKTAKGVTTIHDYFAKDVEAEYEVTPAEFIDLKALMGDASDNIPGVPGVGIKTATKIIKTYHSIEEAYANVDRILPKKAQNALREHYASAVLSKELATILLDAPVTFSKEEAAVGNLFTEEAYGLFKRFDFRNLLSRFSVEEDQPAVPTIVEIKSRAELDNMLLEIKQAEGFGFALQGVPVFSVNRVLQPDANEEAASCIIAGAAWASEKHLYYVSAGEEISGALLHEKTKELLLEAKNVRVCDLKGILNMQKLPESSRIFDVSLAAYLADPLKSSYPYDAICAEYAGVTLPSAEELFGKKMPSVLQMDYEAAKKYFAYQAFAAYSSAGALQKKLDELEMRTLYDTVELPLVYTLSEMERNGMKLDKEALSEYGAHLQENITVLEKQIYEAAGERFNINSPKQLGVILFEKMGLPGAKKTKTGYSTAADVLERLAPDVPFVMDILEYRQLTKLKSTYADALGGYVREDGRIHSSFNQMITATGRLSSADPNLQNIPIRMEEGRTIRKVFVPEEGFVYIDADYSQIELRVLAAMSNDPNLIEAYKEAKDIHRITASQVFHVPFEEVTALQRRSAKAVNFGIVYGISSFGLSQGLDISRAEAAEYIERYFETYPAIKQFLDGLVSSARESGYALTLCGRRRPVPELSASNFMQRSFGERVAMNSPIQGTAADIIKIAMNSVRRRLEQEGFLARLILQVHDELLIEAPEKEAEQVRRLLEEEMCRAAELSVPLEVDVHCGHSWYDAK